MDWSRNRTSLFGGVDVDIDRAGPSRSSSTAVGYRPGSIRTVRLAEPSCWMVLSRMGRPLRQTCRTLRRGASDRGQPDEAPQCPRRASSKRRRAPRHLIREFVAQNAQDAALAATDRGDFERSPTVTGRRSRSPGATSPGPGPCPRRPCSVEGVRRNLRRGRVEEQIPHAHARADGARRGSPAPRCHPRCRSDERPHRRRSATTATGETERRSKNEKLRRGPGHCRRCGRGLRRYRILPRRVRCDGQGRRRRIPVRRR